MTRYADDPRLLDAKSMPIAQVVAKLGIENLRHMSNELIGPCPLCSGRDRFGINTTSNLFQCRKCGIKGGDQVGLVRAVLGLSFKDALGWLCGDMPADIDPAEMDRRRAKAAAVKRKQDEFAHKQRVRAIRDACDIWERARLGHLGIVPAYLAARGITSEMLPKTSAALRFIVDHPYVKKIDGQFVTLHRGPAMIAGILDAQGRLTAVHQTWVDAAAPHGKAKIMYGQEVHTSKLVRGSKRGGAIRLATPGQCDTLVMGEGIETTLTAMVARAIPNAAYWAGVDLGNMSGRMQRTPGTRHSGIPDMSDIGAFVPPVWVKHLVFIQDGDSAPKMTRAKLECGLRRAMAYRPGLQAKIVHAGDGVDLNDILVQAG
jgi:hypothetical protein